jgi:ABC-type branched-subunit amino acid transport system ATPase component
MTPSADIDESAGTAVRPRPWLAVDGVAKYFGGLAALSNVSLEIRKGEIYGLIGPNGAGKTTFFNVLTGLYAPSAGEIALDGNSLIGLKPNEVVAAGVARTFQNIRLFANMTALENVMVGRHVRTRVGVFGAVLRTPGTRREEQGIRARAQQLLDYVGIGSRADELARHLAYGDQRRLEIARALATDPVLLALDEPAAGMNPSEAVRLQQLLQRIRDDGVTILLIEHHVKLVMGVRPRSGTRLRQADRRGQAAAGTDRSEGDRGLPRGFARMKLLEVRDLEVAYDRIKAVKGVSLHVEKGELVCLIGANGAGKTTTLKALAGMLPPAAGEVQFDGATVTNVPSHRLVRRGIALVPEGRGIFSRLTVLENLKLGAYARTDGAAVNRDLEHVFGLFERLAERRQQVAGTLSGGEQQMLAIGRALMSRPRLMLLDEPSMGLAPLLVQKIFEIIRRIASEGVTILLVEQNAKLALEVSQRGYVMEGGMIALTDAAPALLKNPQVQQAYLGA